MPPHILQPGGTEVITRAGGAQRYRKPLRDHGWSDFRGLFQESISAWSRHNDTRLGASLAFYTLFSLAPLLLVAVSIGGLVFGREAAEGQILNQIAGLIGTQGASGVQALLAGARNPQHGIVATVLGLITLLFGASGVLLELRGALNTIWEVPPSTTSGLRSVLQIVRDRLLSFALVLAVGFLLLVSLIVNAGIAAVGAFFTGALPIPEVVLQLINLAISLIISTGLFAAIYKLVPEPHLEWRDVFFGSVVTAILFSVGKFLIGLYLGKATLTSTYGAAASVILLILWVYYSGQVFFLGAEFTRAFALSYGSQPDTHGASDPGQAALIEAPADHSPTR